MTSEDLRRELAALATSAGAAPNATVGEQLEALAHNADRLGRADDAATFREFATRAAEFYRQPPTTASRKEDRP